MKKPKILSFIAAMVSCLALAGPSMAQGLIRDAEIERTLKIIARPLFQASGLSAAFMDILVVNDQTLNAFVADNRTIFVNAGLIQKLGTPAMLQSVLAHEMAHITSGHLARRAANMRSARSAAGVGILLGLAAGLAGANAAGVGLAAGASSAAQRGFFVHTRVEESAADILGVRYMTIANIDANAAVEVLNIFRGQDVLSVGRRDPYTLTHPLSGERIRTLQAQIALYDTTSEPTPPDTAYWHARMIAKFNGFIRNPSWMLRRVNENDTSEIAHMIRAIAYHRMPDQKKAIAEINALLAMKPDDPFYHELKGQILLESGKAKAALPSYERAVALAPKESLILAGLGRVLLAVGGNTANKRALKVLERARNIDGRDARMLRDLAVAYAKSGNNGMASLVTAERYALLSRFSDAETHALRASGLLSRGSSGWLRAQDVLAVAKAAIKSLKKRK